MKKIYFLLIIGLMGVKTYGQMGEWTWMNGSDTINAIGHYGTQGVFDSLNSPPGLYEACEWTDLNGNFWLFGGVGHSFGNSDLWEYNPSINQWAWIKGTGISMQFSNYGTEGIPSPTNMPGYRGWGILTWIDTLGDLWLFGGQGNNATTSGYLNDLWKYNISTNEWTWMSGTDSVNSKGNYGTISIFEPSNYPPSRSETSASWTDNINCLWLFGGITEGINGLGYLADLWKYDISTNQWVWINGSNMTNQQAVYGTKGVSDTANHPNGRQVYSKWKESNGNFWLFCGTSPNDLWKYNPTSNEWTWMSGNNIPNDTGISGQKCISSINDYPSCRLETRTCWTRKCDNFELFGGVYNGYFNDIWNYSVNTNEWTLMAGSALTHQHLLPDYGVETISNLSNDPGGRDGSIGWKDNSENLWLFGGAVQNGMFVGYRNDIWRFVPDSTCTILCGNREGLPECQSNKSSISLYPNPTSGTFTLSIRNYESGIRNELEITDVLGNTVYQQAIINQQSSFITLPQLSNGVYFYQVKNSKETFRGKLVKEN